MLKCRVTRPNWYPENSLGANDPSARQGYYFRVESIEELHNQVFTQLKGEPYVDVQVWDMGASGDEYPAWSKITPLRMYPKNIELRSSTAHLWKQVGQDPVNPS